MNIHAGKDQRNKSKPAANAASKNHGNGESIFQFLDHRSNTSTHRELQDMADQSHQVNNLRAMQNIADHRIPQRQPVRQEMKPIEKTSLGAGGTLIQAYAEEDWLIARLRGLDTLLNARKEAKLPLNDLIVEELEKLTEEIEAKNWLRAVSVMLALREKYGIDAFPPPLIPIDSPELVDGDPLLESPNIKFLPRPLRELPEDQPGSRRIELGAGPMDSARAFWGKEKFTAFTEFRSKEDLTEDYQERFTGNLEAIEKIDPENEQENTIAYGVDATQEGTFSALPLTENLRFTNPNIGHQDIAEEIGELIREAVSENNEDNLIFSSMGMTFFLSMDRLWKYKNECKKMNWLETVITSTVNSISTCRNVFMLHKFMLNAPGKLIPGPGKVEIIVSTPYLKRWPLQEMAKHMGYAIDVKPIDLGFNNIKTQESEDVGNDKQPEKSMLTLSPPWGGTLKTSSVLAWVHDYMAYSHRQPTLLYAMLE